MPIIAKAYDDTISALELEEAAAHGISSTGIQSIEFREQSPRPADAYYFPLDNDARGYAPSNWDTKTINPAQATDLAFDEDGCWVGQAVTNLWPMRSSHSDDQIPDDPAGISYYSASDWIVDGFYYYCCDAALVNGKLRLTCNTTAGAVFGLVFTTSKYLNLPSNSTIRCRIRKISGTAGFSWWGSETGSGGAESFPLSTTDTWHAFTTTGIGFDRFYVGYVGGAGVSVGDVIELSDFYIGNGAYLNGDNYSKNRWGWIGNSTTSFRPAPVGSTRVSLIKAGGATVTHYPTDAANTLNITAGLSYTVSAYYRNESGEALTPSEFKLAGSTGGAILAKTAEKYTIPVIKSQWQRGIGTATYTSSSAAWPYILSSSATASETRICGCMIESKMFASAWCPNSRAQGLLTWNLNTSCGLNWNADYTIIYWKKAHGTDGGIAGYSIDSIGRNTNTIGGGYRWWGKVAGTLGYGISGTTGLLPSWDAYQYKWNMHVLKRSGTNMTLRLYGFGSNGLFLTQTIDDSPATTANRYVTQNGCDLQLGGWDQINACNTYYRDLMVIPGRAMSDAELAKIYNSKLRAFTNYIAAGQLIEGII